MSPSPFHGTRLAAAATRPAVEVAARAVPASGESQTRLSRRRLVGGYIIDLELEESSLTLSLRPCVLLGNWILSYLAHI